MARSALDLEKENVHLDEAAQDMREATRALDYNEPARGAAEILVAITRLETLIEQQMEREKQLQESMAETAGQMREMLEQAEQLAGTSEAERMEMRRAVTGGLMEAHSMATEHAIKEISEVSQAAQDELRELEKQARARTMRLFKVTLPDKLFNLLKWLLILMGLVIGGWFLFFVALGQ